MQCRFLYKRGERHQPVPPKIGEEENAATTLWRGRARRPNDIEKFLRGEMVCRNCTPHVFFFAVALFFGVHSLLFCLLNVQRRFATICQQQRFVLCVFFSNFRFSWAWIHVSKENHRHILRGGLDVTVFSTGGICDSRLVQMPDSCVLTVSLCNNVGVVIFCAWSLSLILRERAIVDSFGPIFGLVNFCASISFTSLT